MTNESADDRTAAPDGGHRSIDDDRTSESNTDPLFQPSIRNFPWLTAGVSGAVTLLIEYVLIGILFVVGPASTSERVTAAMEQLTSYAFVLYGSHNVPVVRSPSGDFRFRGASHFNLVTSAENPAIPILVYLVIPVVALLVVGAVFEWWRSRNRDEGLYEGAALVGLGHVPGYLFVGLLASFVFVSTTTYNSGGSVTQSADKLYLLVALTIYPLLATTLGALCVRLYRNQETLRSTVGLS